MSKKEFTEALLFLKRGAKRWLPSYPWVIGVLKEDIKRTIPVKGGYLVNIRVPATEVIAEKYNLTNYKRGNFMILVMN
jgi:hypothetical protein